jgi:hypothetical protein
LHFITVVLGMGAGYLFWKGNIASKVAEDSAYGVYAAVPMLLVIMFGMVVVFLFTLRRILVRTGILKKEESLRYLRSRSWYRDEAREEPPGRCPRA